MIALGENADRSKLVLLTDQATPVGPMVQLEISDDAAEALTAQLLNLLEARRARRDGLTPVVRMDREELRSMFPAPALNETDEAAARDAAELARREAEEARKKKEVEADARRARALAARAR